MGRSEEACSTALVEAVVDLVSHLTELAPGTSRSPSIHTPLMAPMVGLRALYSSVARRLAAASIRHHSTA